MEAVFYDKLDNLRVRCRLCPNECVVSDGGAGICRIRRNCGGVLEAEGYGRVVTLAIDPIEKKPLYHFHPGKDILSTGANGCNFHCGFCQNSDISQGRVATRYVAPEELAELAGRDGSIGVAYTYTEPFIWFEYIRDAGKEVKDRGLVNVLVTNGYVNEEPLRELLPLIDAMNIDIKSMNPDFYTSVCGGKLDDVLRTVTIAAESCHVEVTNLVITGHNDTDDDFERLTDWLAEIDPAIPLHLSRYFPRYKFDAPPTPTERLERAYETARKKLHYVYLGNMLSETGTDTVCPSCGVVLVNRRSYAARVTGIRDGCCMVCGAKVDFTGV